MLRSVSILVTSVCIATVASAETFVIKPNPTVDPTAEMDERVLAARDAVLSLTTYEYSGEELPTIIVITPEELVTRAYDAETLLEFERKGKTPPQLNAFYERGVNTIYLGSNEAAQNTLVHEMVHFFQHISGKSDELAEWPHCLEAEAYDVQYTWHHMTGQELEQSPDYGFVLTLYGVCNDADFSWNTN